MDIADFRRWFAYDDWANREVLSALEHASEPPPRSVALIAHIVAAELLWHARLLGKPQPLAVWHTLTLIECAMRLDDARAAWTSYLTSVGERGLESLVQYTNTKGEPFSSAVRDILTHVVMHGTYHRGQIASDLRAHGFEPAYTDFIHAVRKGFVK
jgi:uncharacterized damage-inducible protein DinB